jgi:hypothetical protein
VTTTGILFDRAASNTGTDREVDEILNASCRAPTPFGKRGGIHISIEANRQV